MGIEERHAKHHAIPFRVLISAFGALLILTAVTVITSKVNIGTLNVPLAIAIASAKSILVVSVFMALRYDNRVNALVFFVGIVFVVVFLALTLADTALRGALGITDDGVIPSAAPKQIETPSEHILVPAADSAANIGHIEAAAPAISGPDLFARYLCTTCHSTVCVR